MLKSVLIAISVLLAETKKAKSKKNLENTEVTDVVLWIYYSLFLLLILGIVLILIKKNVQRLRQKKSEKIKQLMKAKQQDRQQIQLKKKQYRSSMTPMQKQEAIKVFQSKNWILEQSGKEFTAPKIYKLTVGKVQRKTEEIYDSFEINLSSGNFLVGCYLSGFIMFQKFYMVICFELSMSNLPNSKGNYDFTIFEGQQKAGAFEGGWQQQKQDGKGKSGSWKLSYV